MNNLDLEMACLTIKKIHFPVSPPSEKVNPVLFEMTHLDLETTSPIIVEIHPPDSSSSEEIKTIYMISSVTTPLSTDLTTRSFRTNEEILEALTAPNYPWDDIPSLDPAILAHHIDTWPDVPPVCQKQRSIHL